MENIYQRITQSAFEAKYRAGVSANEISFKELERLGKFKVPSEYSQAKYRVLLESGIPISFLGINYIAQLQINEGIKGNQIKKLSRQRESTKSPKSGRKTVYRRNSPVVERSRQPKNWRTNQNAKNTTLLASKVVLISKEEWIARQKTIAEEKSHQEGIRIASKKSGLVARNIKAWNEAVETPSEMKKIVDKLVELSEKNGVINQEKLLVRLENNLRTNKPQAIVFVWGPPYEKQGTRADSFQKNQPESIMLKQILDTLNELKALGLKINPILIYADTYGSQLNQISEDEVSQYFTEIKQNLPPEITPLRISQILAENENQIPNIPQSEPTLEEIKAAKKVQIKLGNKKTSGEIYELAKQYRRMRLVEGELLTTGITVNGEKITDIIKLATAPDKRKDDPYEPNLPRFYIKNMTRAAWNKPRKEKNE